MQSVKCQLCIIVSLCTIFASGCQQSGQRGFSLWNRQYSPSRFARKMEEAQALERKQQLAEAKKIYEDLHQRNPENVQACHRLAIVHIKEGDHNVAKEYFSKALKLDPDNPDVHIDLGVALYKQKDLPNAERAFRKALSSDPQSKLASNHLGVVLAQQGKVDESLSHLRRTYPPDEAHWRVASILKKQGNYSAAQQQYRNALRLTKHPESRVMIQRELISLASHLPKVQVAKGVSNESGKGVAAQVSHEQQPGIASGGAHAASVKISDRPSLTKKSSNPSPFATEEAVSSVPAQSQAAPFPQHVASNRKPSSTQQAPSGSTAPWASQFHSDTSEKTASNPFLDDVESFTPRNPFKMAQSAPQNPFAAKAETTTPPSTRESRSTTSVDKTPGNKTPENKTTVENPFAKVAKRVNDSVSNVDSAADHLAKTKSQVEHNTTVQVQKVAQSANRLAENPFAKSVGVSKSAPVSNPFPNSPVSEVNLVKENRLVHDLGNAHQQVDQFTSTQQSRVDDIVNLVQQRANKVNRQVENGNAFLENQKQQISRSANQEQKQISRWNQIAKAAPQQLQQSVNAQQQQLAEVANARTNAIHRDVTNNLQDQIASNPTTTMAQVSESAQAIQNNVWNAANSKVNPSDEPTETIASNFSSNRSQLKSSVEPKSSSTKAIGLANQTNSHSSDTLFPVDLAGWVPTRATQNTTPSQPVDVWKGICPVTLREQHTMAEANSDFQSNYGGKSYRFSSANAKAMFDQNPTKYIAAANEMDLVKQNRDQQQVQGTIDYACWYQQRLYFFSSEETKQEFESNPHRYISGE